jgi:AraC family transcriptional regulator
LNTPLGNRRALARELLETVPPAPGGRIQSQRGGFVYAVRQPGALTFNSFGDFAAVLLAPVPRLRWRPANGTWLERHAPAGSVLIRPAGSELGAEWQSPLETVSVGFLPGELRQLAAAGLDVPEFELSSPPLGRVDETALRIATEMKHEVHRRGILNELFVDSLMTAFGVHLLRNYSNLGDRPVAEGSFGLHPAVAARVEEFLQANHSRKLTMREIAAVTGLSEGHFLRAFSNTFGRPPHQYVLRLRLEHAERLLRTTDLSISEVAAASGFSSQSHLTTAMSQRRKLTPGQIRKSQ